MTTFGKYPDDLGQTITALLMTLLDARVAARLMYFNTRLHTLHF